MRFVILNVHCPEALGFLEGFDYAVMILDPKLPGEWIEHINKAKAMKLEDRDFCSMIWWDNYPTFIDAEGVTDKEQEILCDDQVIIADKPQEFIKDRGSRVEVCRLVADHEGLYWRARPKHVDHNVETSELSLEFLEKLQKGKA